MPLQRIHLRILFASALLGVLAGCGADGGEALPEVVDYNLHVRPVLSDRCYTCHGPDASSREAGLRLDLRDAATAVLESGERAIVPGDPDASALIHRLTTSKEADRMPPVESKKHVSDREIALLERWIEQGAAWKPHWAFVPPEPGDGRSIDAYLDERMDAERLEPAPPASPEALVRRLYVVLTGLPPTPEEVDAFVEEPTDAAYDRLVDALLASPHFGERWARHWMDLVRYAEGMGHEFDYSIEGAWRYRDYLIRAFNAGVPYDRLVREHLAGDLLAEPRLNPEDGVDESVLGTVFLLLGEGKHSPVDVRQEEADAIDNMIDVTTKTFQGLTVGCARCHDHKFDPIPTTDYYALYGVFESTRITPIPAHTTAAMRTAVDSLGLLKQAVRARLADSWRSEVEPSTPRAPVRQAALGGEDIPTPDSIGRGVLGDFRHGHFDGWSADGPAFEAKPVFGDPLFDEAHERVVGLAPGVASSAALSPRLFGALRSPTFRLSTDTIDLVARGRDATARIVIDNFHLIQDPIYGGLQKTIDSEDLETYRFDVSMWKGRKAYVELLSIPHRHREPEADPASFFEVAYAVAHDGDAPDMTLPRPRRVADVAGALAAWADGRADADQRFTIDAMLRGGALDASAAPVAPLLDRYAALERTVYDSTFIIGVTDGDPIDSPVFERGSIHTPGDTPVPRRFFTALDSAETPFSDTGSGRLELAEAIVDPANPLTARVMVNRIWHHVFGRGLVETVDNFGAQGTLPSHPALLDALALRFVDSGWSVKAMIRDMVRSDAFKRSTTPETRSAERDPENRAFHHYTLRRLEAEAIRDALLAVSGRLDRTLFGPSVPTHLTPFMDGRGRPAESGPLDGDGRRSIYLEIRRNFLSPFMLVFDRPIPFSTFGRRNETNVPAQSLTMMNSPFVWQQAEVWAERMLALPGLDADRKVRRMIRAAFARSATDDEVREALDFLRGQGAHYELREEAWRTDLRVWTDYAHALYNAKEFIFLI